MQTISYEQNSFSWNDANDHKYQILDENWRKTPQSKWADASLTNRVIYDALAAAAARLDGVRESE